MTPKFDLPAWLAVPRFGVRSRGTAPYRHPVVALLLGLVLIGLSYLSIPETGQIWAAPSQSPDTATAGKVVDLQVSKIVSNPAPQEGDVVTYTVTVTNFGFQNATEVVISDTLPLNLTLIQSHTTRGGYTGNLWQIGRLKEGEMARLTLAVKIGSGTSGKTITNTAAIFTSQPYAEDEDQAVVTVSGLDVAVAKTVNDKTPANRETITYTVIVTNYGPGTATGVRLDEAWPAEVIPGGYTATQGSYSDVSQDWEVGSLAEGATAALKLNGMVRDCTGGKTISNTVTLSAIDQRDENEENNQASVEIVSQSYCLYLPVVFENYVNPVCSGYFDNFSDSNSGWQHNYEDDTVFLRYDKEKYLVHLKEPSRLIVDAPTSTLNNTYTVTVLSRWQDIGSIGSEYGINFGQVSLPSGEYPYKSYLFVVDAKNQSYRLMYKPNATIDRKCINKKVTDLKQCWKADEDNIRGGTDEPYSENELSVVCTPYRIEIYANGKLLWEENPPPYSCAGGAGIEVRADDELYDRKALFDNFEVSCPVSKSFNNVYKGVAEQSTPSIVVEPPGK